MSKENPEGEKGPSDAPSFRQVQSPIQPQGPSTAQTGSNPQVQGQGQGQGQFTPSSKPKKSCWDCSNRCCVITGVIFSLLFLGATISMLVVCPMYEKQCGMNLNSEDESRSTPLFCECEKEDKTCKKYYKECKGDEVCSWKRDKNCKVKRDCVRNKGPGHTAGCLTIGGVTECICDDNYVSQCNKERPDADDSVCEGTDCSKNEKEPNCN